MPYVKEMYPKVHITHGTIAFERPSTNLFERDVLPIQQKEQKCQR